MVADPAVQGRVRGDRAAAGQRGAAASDLGRLGERTRGVRARLTGVSPERHFGVDATVDGHVTSGHTWATTRSGLTRCRTDSGDTSGGPPRTTAEETCDVQTRTFGSRRSPEPRRGGLRAYLRRFFTSWVAEDPDADILGAGPPDGLGEVPDPVCEPEGAGARVRRGRRTSVRTDAERPEPRPHGRGGTSRPVSRILYPGRSPGGGHPSATPVAGCLVRSTRELGRAALERSRECPKAPFLILLRVGFTEPPRSPGVLVVSYTTVSPLPSTSLSGRRGRFAFCGTVPRVTPGGCCPPPCSVESGLSSVPSDRVGWHRDRPADSSAGQRTGTRRGRGRGSHRSERAQWERSHESRQQLAAQSAARPRSGLA